VSIVFLSLLTCDDPEEILDISGRWNFLKKSTSISITSSLEQLAIDISDKPNQYIEIRGKYDADINQLILMSDNSTNSRTFLFYQGVPWQMAPPQLTIIETDDTVTAEFLYHSSDDIDSEIREVFYPTSFEFSFDFTSGTFEISPTIFYSDTGSGEVTIEGLIQFNIIQLTSDQTTNLTELTSAYNSDEIDMLEFMDDGSLCAYFRDGYWADTLCGQWTLAGEQLTYSLSNGHHREYNLTIEKDTIAFTADEICEHDPDGENLLWISESPESIYKVCFGDKFFFYSD